MTSERWQQVKDILYQALEREPNTRAEFLGQICTGDDELRFEVESLLEHTESEPGFLELSAAEIAGKTMLAHEQFSLIGKMIGPYRILNRIGQGGMGEVYLAARDDHQFHKEVALKLIKRGMDTNSVVLAFRKERQILANLDHPNIARLYDGGTTDDGLPYFVMEHIKGRAITQYCDERRLPISERLKLFRAVCSAVDYAHCNHVVHRDIKPGNILITLDGAPKLLDFGIARVLTPDQAQTATETATAWRLMTPEYASPEQVRGDPITPATDIYSLGAVLYELVTGRRPHRFNTKSPLEMAQVVCEQEPLRPSVSVSRTMSPREGEQVVTPETVSATREQSPEKLRRRLRGDLDDIILKALRKEPQRRYSSAAEFSEDIARHLDGLPVQARRGSAAYRTTKLIKRNSGPLIAACLILVSTSLAVALSYSWFAHRVAARVGVGAKNKPKIRLDNAVRLTSNIGDDNYANWSPDGKKVLYDCDRDGRVAICIIDADGRNQKQFLSDSFDGTGARWSPDGKQIAFARMANGAQGLYLLNLSSSRERLLFNTRKPGRHQWSPDGRRVVFNAKSDSGDIDIFAIDSDGANLVNLTKNPALDVDPTWSPDGKIIAFTSNRAGRLQVFVMAANGGAAKQLTFNESENRTAAWSPDGKRIAFVSNRDGHEEIYVMDSTGNNQTRITYGLADSQEPAWSPDGKVIAFTTTRDGNQEIYLVSTDETGRTIVPVSQSQDSDPHWSPDGTKIIFDTNRNGKVQICQMNADGSSPMAITAADANDAAPVYSPDGRRVVFVGNREGHEDIFVMDANGENETQLTDGAASNHGPAWSPDGKHIAFVSNRDGNGEIYVMNADGSNQIRLTNNPAQDEYPTWSSDGSKIAFYSFRDGNNEIYVMNADGSNPINLTRNPANDGQPAWSPDGRRIAFNTTRDGLIELYVMNADGSNPSRLTHTGSPAIIGHPSWAPDGKRLAYTSNQTGYTKIYVMDVPPE